MKSAVFTAILVSLAALPGASHAQSTRGQERVVATSESFLASHPDLRFRLQGLDAVNNGRPEQAVALFRRAARYADKPSQSMLGEMHWTGVGVPLDRVLGYIWMDVAAERGFPLMVAKRESYWSQLSPEERVRARETGVAVMDEFGDAAAKPRIEKILLRAKRNVTGSRVGNVGNLVIQIPTPTGFREVSGDDYYDRKFWEPERYFQWQDQDWVQPQGTVDVGDVEAAPAKAAEQD
ncbi:MAG: sel1 repeat family protein [Arenimonas sp.]|nr:sel1 repeat family protein [Arenimonas sp.]MBP6626819.1 sel1 repeat family protein [Arenimonas sp.]